MIEILRTAFFNKLLRDYFNGSNKLRVTSIEDFELSPVISAAWLGLCYYQLEMKMGNVFCFSEEKFE